MKSLFYAFLCIIGCGFSFSIGSKPLESGKVGFAMEIKSISARSVVYRVELSGVSDDDVVNKGVAHCQEAGCAEGDMDHAWRHGGTALAYVGIRAGLESGASYYLTPFVELSDGSVVYGQSQLITTYESSDDVPRLGNTRWYWDDPWFMPNPKDTTEIKDSENPRILSKHKVIAARMDSASYYYSVYCSKPKNIKVKYKTSVPTANSVVGGQTINFGGQMGLSTALHEISHSIGVGSKRWQNIYLDDSKKYCKPIATQLIIELTNNPNAKISGDKSHFWPFNMNYSKDLKSEEDAIRHVMILEAMVQDGL